MKIHFVKIKIPDYTINIEWANQENLSKYD